MEKKNLQMFSPTFEIDPNGDVTSELIFNNLLALEDNMAQYFPSITVVKYDWVRNPYAMFPESKPTYIWRKKSNSQNFSQTEHGELLLGCWRRKSTQK